MAINIKEETWMGESFLIVEWIELIISIVINRVTRQVVSLAIFQIQSHKKASEIQFKEVAKNQKWKDKMLH